MRWTGQKRPSRRLLPKRPHAIWNRRLVLVIAPSEELSPHQALTIPTGGDQCSRIDFLERSRATMSQNEHMKHFLTAVSIALAIGALILGLCAARYWWKASKIEIDPGWNSGLPGDTRSAEPADLEGIGTLNGWLNATMQSVKLSSELNKAAAKLTAYAVVFAGVSSVVGAFTSLF